MTTDLTDLRSTTNGNTFIFKDSSSMLSFCNLCFLLLVFLLFIIIFLIPYSLLVYLHPNSPHNRINFFQPLVDDVDVVEIDSVGRRPCEDFIGCKLEEI